MREISIVVPVYNVEKYLDKCITSILKQSFNDFELILVNDGSEDASAAICDKYKEKDVRIKVIHQLNAGLSAARNVGIEISKGKYITFIDSDDHIHPNMLETLYDNMLKNEADISVCNYQLVYEDKKMTKEFFVNNIKIYNNIEGVKRIVEKSEASMIVACGKLYNKSLFCDIRYPLGKYHEDEFVTYKLLYKSNNIVVTDAKLYYYLQRSGSITGNTYSIKRLEKLEALEEAIKFFTKENNEELINLAEFRYLLNIQIAYYKIKYEMNHNKKIMDELKIKYNTKYHEYSTTNIIKKLMLKLFYISPNKYCALVRLFFK